MGTRSGRSPDVSVEDSASGRTSFFSRFSLPLRSRTRNLADFHIRPDEPHRQYAAGDHVTGSVVLACAKSIRITHLTVTLHGYVRAYKNPGAAAQEPVTINPSLMSEEGRKSSKYFGNGHASLFRDEQVLCGEGRLEAQRYEFGFDLIFPSKGLPSSIDFERGTITYMITATLTRPTSISAISNCERKISLVERVDVGLLTPPRPRTIHLDPISRKTRKRKPVGTTERSSLTIERTENASDLDSIRENENATETTGSLMETPHASALHGHAPNAPRSPIHSEDRSEVSGESATSINSATHSIRALDTSAASNAGSRISGADEKTITTSAGTITATVELLKGGCLPGDLIPVKVSIQHTRHIKSMHGVVVTLFRQGRVDYAPPLSLFTNLTKEEARRLEREEYYPKSKTGLGGLSLSSAGSCSVFRKDLSQAVAPLIVDPQTLTATINTSVRVPTDIFPTIKGVPGEMISFKYHVEVLVDLGGKLANQTQSAQQTRSGPLSTPGGGSNLLFSPYEGGPGMLGNWNGTIMETDHIRREKGVIFVSFEVIMGTVDSSRSRQRGKLRLQSSQTLQAPAAPGTALQSEGQNQAWRNGFPEETPAYDQSSNIQGAPSYFPPVTSPRTAYYDFQTASQPSAPAYISPPQLPDQNGMSEKERIRQAEQRLLPSAPPQSNSEPEAGPSRVQLPVADDDNGGEGSSSRVNGHIMLSNPADEGAPSAPTLDEISHGRSANSTDDKQEMERRRLLDEASAPPETPDDYEVDEAGPSAPSAPSAPTDLEPSAPILHEEDEYGDRNPLRGVAGPSSQTTPRPSEQLPRYER